MPVKCTKLSQTIPLSDGHDIKSYLSSLYPIYKREIAEKKLFFHGKPIYVFTDLNYNLQHQTFEHLTTKGSEDRLYNLKRSERILWVRDILGDVCEHNPCENYRVFRDTKWKGRKDAIRYVIWCVKEDYAIILEERPQKVMLITAYCVLYNNKREDFESEYQKAKQKRR